MSERIHSEVIGSIIIVVFGTFFFWWTYHEDLPGGAAIVPRIAAGAIICGGGSILFRALRGRTAVRIVVSRHELLMALVLLSSLGVYAFLMLWLGLAVAIFIFLMGWWLVLFNRMRGSHAPWMTPLALAGIAGGMSAFCYSLFILLLDMYLPNTALF